MDMWLSGGVQGLCYCLLAIGIYITFRIYNFPDITADGSITIGGAIMASSLIAGYSPVLGLFFSTVGGFVSGVATGFIHTKLKVNALLSGILVATSLYTVNLWIMGMSNVPLLTVSTLFSNFISLFPNIPKLISLLIYLTIINLGFIILITLLIKTDFGLAMRATGDNEIMITSQGVNVDFYKIFGIGLSNAIIAISGALVAQYQNYADINMGIGTIVYGLASVIIGESIARLISTTPSFFIQFICILFGSVIFRSLVTVAINLGFNVEIKLITALLVLFAVAIPQVRKRE